jgi:hypothetical protein
MEHGGEAGEGLDGPSDADPADAGQAPAPTGIDPANAGLVGRATLAALALLVAGALWVSPAAAQDGGTARAWGIEAVGGVIGSAAGFGLGLLAVDDDDCGDNLDCILSDVAAVLATATGGATLGAWGLGRAADTEPSFGGAAVGALAGAAAGLGMIKVLDEISDQSERAVAVIGFSIAQGAVTALGSRIGAALR